LEEIHVEKEWTSEKRNITAYLLLLVAIVCIVIAIVLGQSQDGQFIQEAQANQTGSQMLQQHKSQEAEKLLKPLLDLHPDNYVLQWEYAISLSQQKKYSEADTYFARVRQTRPAIVQIPQYLMQYAIVLKGEGQQERAKQYLDQARKVNNDPSLAQQIDQLLQGK
jgi:predicted Zn-dependent protease